MLCLVFSLPDLLNLLLSSCPEPVGRHSNGRRWMLWREGWFRVLSLPRKLGHLSGCSIFRTLGSVPCGQFSSLTGHTQVSTPLTPRGNVSSPSLLIDPRLENVFLRQGHLWLLIRLSYGIIHQLLKKYIIFIIKNNITYVTEELKNRKKRNKNKP